MLQVMPGHALTGRRIESRHALTAFTTNQSNHNCLPGRGSGSDPSSGTWRTPAEASNSQKETEKEVEQLEPSRVARSVAAAAPHAGVPCGRCCRQLLLLPLPLYSVGRLAVPLPHHQQHNVAATVLSQATQASLQWQVSSNSSKVCANSTAGKHAEWPPMGCRPPAAVAAATVAAAGTAAAVLSTHLRVHLVAAADRPVVVRAAAQAWKIGRRSVHLHRHR